MTQRDMLCKIADNICGMDVRSMTKAERNIARILELKGYVVTARIVDSDETVYRPMGSQRNKIEKEGGA